MGFGQKMGGGWYPPPIFSKCSLSCRSAVVDDDARDDDDDDDDDDDARRTPCESATAIEDARDARSR